MTTEAPLFLLDGLRENQRRAVLSREPFVVVGAGAGTGKTRTLAARFAWLVVQGLAASEILTLTFTEKAAQEMADRIGATLDQWARELRTRGDAGADRLDDERARIGEAPISTIHAFAYDVVRRNALHLGLPPGTSLPTVPDEEAFWRSAAEALERLDRPWFDVRLPRERAHLALCLDDGKTRSLLESQSVDDVIALARSTAALFGSRDGSPDSLPLSAEAVAALDEEARSLYATRRRAFWRDACAWWGAALEAIEPDGKAKAKVEPLFAALKARWADPDEENLAEAVVSLVRFFQEIAATKGHGAAIYKAAQAELERRSGERFVRLVDFRDALIDRGALQAWMDLGEFDGDRERRARFLGLAALLWALWEEEKRRRGFFGFDDMIRLGRDLLRDHPQGITPFRAILVDEFQDTDVVQDELIAAAARASRASGPCPLFIVGDLKQSIYRFRHAEPDLFADAIARARGKEEGTAYEALTESFRSRSAHLHVVNGLFGHIWREGLTAKRPLPYEELGFPDDLPWWGQRDGASKIPALTLLMEAKDGEAPEGVPEEERDDVARRRLVRALALTLESMRGRPLWDGREGRIREATWRDMALLVPTRSAYGLLEEVLCWERGLPAVFLGRKTFFSRGEVRDAVCLLRALADGEDDRSLAGWLASPFSGLDLREATTLADEASRDGKPLARVVADRRPDVAADLERKRRRALVLGPARLLEELTFRAEPLMALAPYLRRRALANLGRAIDRAREFETARGRSLRGCADYMARGAEEQGSLEEAPVLGEKEDVIRVLSVHAAKGLEFPIVALLGLERSVGQRPRAGLAPSRFVGAALSRGDSDEEPPSKKLHDVLEREDLVEESRRLFYVAATRAQEALILCGLLGGRSREKEAPGLPEGSWLADVASWLAEGRGDTSKEGLYEALREHRLPDGAWLRTETARPRRASAPRRRGTEPPAGEPFLEWTGASAFALFSFCPYAYRLRYRLEMPLEWDSEIYGDDDDPERPWTGREERPGRLAYGNALFGSLVHHLLGRVWNLTPEGLDEALPQASSAEGKRLESEMAREIRPLWRDDAVRRNLTTRLKTFAATEICRNLAEELRLGRLRRETVFAVDLPGGPSLRGAMDLFWDDGTLRLRDFKTGAPSEAGHILYGAQLAFYGLALERLRDKTVEAGLIYLDGREENFPPTDAGATEEAVRAFARTAVAGPFPPRGDRCPFCPWREGCPGRVRP